MKIYISRSVNQGVRVELEQSEHRRRKRDDADDTDVDEFIQPEDGVSEVDHAKQDDAEVNGDED